MTNNCYICTLSFVFSFFLLHSIPLNLISPVFLAVLFDIFLTGSDISIWKVMYVLRPDCGHKLVTRLHNWSLLSPECQVGKVFWQMAEREGFFLPPRFTKGAHRLAPLTTRALFIHRATAVLRTRPPSLPFAELTFLPLEAFGLASWTDLYFRL